MGWQAWRSFLSRAWCECPTALMACRLDSKDSMPLWPKQVFPHMSNLVPSGKPRARRLAHAHSVNMPSRAMITQGDRDLRVRAGQQVPGVWPGWPTSSADCWGATVCPPTCSFLFAVWCGVLPRIPLWQSFSSVVGGPWPLGRCRKCFEMLMQTCFLYSTQHALAIGSTSLAPGRHQHAFMLKLTRGSIPQLRLVCACMQDYQGVGNEIGRQLLRTRRSFRSTVFSADGEWFVLAQCSCEASSWGLPSSILSCKTTARCD